MFVSYTGDICFCNFIKVGADNIAVVYGVV
nr:MAG TPA: hypothetical protein [Caudoviricetes sp.]